MNAVITVKNAQAAFELLEQLNEAGLVNDRDFTWAFTPAKYDYYGHSESAAIIEFRFVDEKNATYFKLKWA